MKSTKRKSLQRMDEQVFPDLMTSKLNFYFFSKTNKLPSSNFNSVSLCAKAPEFRIIIQQLIELYNKNHN